MRLVKRTTADYDCGFFGHSFLLVLYFSTPFSCPCCIIQTLHKRYGLAEHSTHHVGVLHIHRHGTIVKAKEGSLNIVLMVRIQRCLFLFTVACQTLQTASSSASNTWSCPSVVVFSTASRSKVVLPIIWVSNTDYTMRHVSPTSVKTNSSEKLAPTSSMIKESLRLKAQKHEMLNPK